LHSFSPERLAELDKVLFADDEMDAFTLEAKGWRAWLPKTGPRTFTGSFAPFHAELWDWLWDLTVRRKAGERLSEEKKAFLALWPRGFGKSSSVEWAAILEGALMKTGYVLYVCGTSSRAAEHVASIKQRIESEEVARFYPHLASPLVGKHGNQYGWRQDFLQTEGGWAIRPVGLEEAIRGGKVGDVRPSLIILDDVDEFGESPAMTEKKKGLIARSILPAGGRDTVILFAQNLIHRNSVANQIHARRTDVLARRIESGPFQAFEGLVIEQENTDDGPLNIIKGGAPTWDDMDLAACQDFLHNSGREAFLAEYQNDFEASEQGRVIPEYDERIHVISWSQFREKIGQGRIPAHWQAEAGLDIGYTPEHLTAWSFVATAAANSPLPGRKFRYRGLTYSEPMLDEMVEDVKRNLYPDELRMLKRLRMSHEKKGERMVLNQKHGLMFTQCKSGKMDGIQQWRHHLRVDKRKPHPFHDDRQLENGTWELGEPSWFDVVDDNQVKAPRDDRGLKVHREQVIAWRYAPTPLTETGMRDALPVKAFEDTNDSTRMITAEWGPRETPLTKDEQFEKEIPVMSVRQIQADIATGARSPNAYHAREVAKREWDEKHNKPAFASSLAARRYGGKR
jgi:hypothetical protein